MIKPRCRPPKHFLLYLDMTTLSGGTSSAQFPLDQLCLCRLLHYSAIELVLPLKEGEEGLKVYPFFQDTLWESFKEEHHLTDMILLSVSLSPPSPSRRRLPHRGRIWLSPSLTVVARCQPGNYWELAHEMQGLLGSTKIGRSGWPGSMTNGEPRQLKRLTLPSRRSSLRQAQLTQSSCCSHASPLQFPFTI